MKLKYIFTTILAALALTSCVEDLERHLDEVQVSSSYVALPAEGGSQTITVTSTADWKFSEIPDWLTISPESGAAGETTVTFSAGKAASTNEATVYLNVYQKSQLINVIQMTEKVDTPLSTCKEVNSGEDGVTYRIKGAVKNISNTTYGNYYVNDGTDEVYVYGTLDASGTEKNFSSLGISEGDIVTVEGPRKTYGGTIELVNVTVISIEKSLIKVDSVEPESAELPIEGGEFTVNLSCSGEGVSASVPESAKSWLTIKSVSASDKKAVVVFTASANAGGDRSTTIEFSTVSDGVTYSATTALSQKGSIIETTIDNILAAEDGDTQYRVTGYITSDKDSEYGNIYIKDATGEIYIYGVLDSKGQAKQWKNMGINVGDIITVVGPKASFNGAAQLKNVSIENHYAVKDISLADFRNLTDDKTAYYRISGTVAKSTEENTKFDLETYGNFALTDGTTEVYVYGVRTGWGGAKGQFKTLGVKEGDKLTIVCYKTRYNGLIEADGCFYISHEAGAVEPDPEPDPEPSIVDATVDQILAAEDGDTQYRVTGYISSVKNTTFGNYNIKDATGEVLVYGTLDASGASKNFSSLGINEGDIVTVVGPKTSYNGTAQLKNVTVESHKAVKDITVADFVAKDDNSDVYYRIKGTVSGVKDTDSYGNIYVADETGSVYVYGIVAGWGGAKKQFQTLGIKDGDILTLVGNVGSYKGTKQVANAFFVAKEEGKPGTDEPSTDNPYSIDLSYTLGTNAYDDGVATINGVKDQKVLKIGTSKAAGSITVTIPAGTKKVSFYAVAWKGNATTLTFSMGGTVVAEQAIAANVGATSNSPYTITVADTDKYEFTIPVDLTVDTPITISTKEGAKPRAIFFGLKK